MAGIGFELKKIFSKEGMVQGIKAYAYSSIVTIGPAIIAILLVLFVQYFLTKIGIDFGVRMEINCAIVYAFIFSQIITSGFSMLITRYISDCIFMKKQNKILPSLYGVLIICLSIGALIMSIFYIKSPLNSFFKLLGYTFTLEMIIVSILTTYLSALKNYMRIVKSYIAGFFVTVILMVSLLIATPLAVSNVTLVSVILGFFIIILGVLHALIEYFKTYTGEGKVFEFLVYFDKYRELFFIGLFYTLGLYSHNFIYWFGDSGIIVSETFRIYPDYDIPSFYASIVMMPILVYFVVQTETTFYEEYQKYYKLIVREGKYNAIEAARDNMCRTLWDELRNIVEIQTIIVVCAIIGGNIILTQTGRSEEIIGTYTTLVFGVFSCSLMYIIMLLLLYYDDRKGAFYIAATFCISGIVGTYLVRGLGLHGAGYLFGSLIALYIAYWRLSYYLENINYYTFSAQPIIVKEKRGVFTWLSHKLM